MERRGVEGHHPELTRFLLRETAGSDTGSGRPRVDSRPPVRVRGLGGSRGSRRIDVVGLDGPAEEWGPPASGGGFLAGALIRLLKAGRSAGPDRRASERDETRRHCLRVLRR